MRIIYFHNSKWVRKALHKVLNNGGITYALNNFCHPLWATIDYGLLLMETYTFKIFGNFMLVWVMGNKFIYGVRKIWGHLNFPYCYRLHLRRGRAFFLTLWISTFSKTKSLFSIIFNAFFYFYYSKTTRKLPSWNFFRS